MSNTANDQVWEKILEDLAVVSVVNRQGFCDISSDAIKQHKREPRLACKIDFRQHRPKPLERENLSVLAIKNGYYRVARTDPFIDIDWGQLTQSGQIQKRTLPDHIQVLSADHLTSEPKALDAAMVAHMLKEVFDDEVDLVLRGREYSDAISFNLPDLQNNKVTYPIQHVQIEVDGGYEGSKGIYLIEAKISKSDNMNLRQLLYPQLHYQKRFPNKKVQTYVMFYEPGARNFHFLPFIVLGDEYDFDRGGYRCFTLNQETEHYTWNGLQTTQIDLQKTNVNVPFPQADKFDKILAIFYKLAQRELLNKEELFSDYDIAPRQFDYYANVLLWMRLAKRGENQSYSLTAKGKRLSTKFEVDVLYKMAQIVFSNDLCNGFLKSENPVVPIDIRRRNGLNAETTYERRLQTVRSWRKYFRKRFS